MSLLKNIFKIFLPFFIGLTILWWMYRGTDWNYFREEVLHNMSWGWMAVSLLFGILPQVFRAQRWRIALKPLGEEPDRRICRDAIFLSYASSLVIPRIGEVTRCGTLKKYAGTGFTRSLGTVVTERLVDSLLMLLLTAVALALQIPKFMQFLHETGTNPSVLFRRFTGTGYLVTLGCLLLIAVTLFVLLRKYSVFRKGRALLSELIDGIASLRRVERPLDYLLYSLGIWVGYFLHFYIAFFCFDFTAGISPAAAFLIFCVGSFAVLVPTPNGAGPWHFAVKTMLVIYGVSEGAAILFALAVHTIQTALVILLGVYGWADLNMLSSRPRPTVSDISTP